MAVNYWDVRRAIEKAAKEKNDEMLAQLQKLHPQIFKNVVGFAKNQMRQKK